MAPPFVAKKDNQIMTCFDNAISTSSSFSHSLSKVLGQILVLQVKIQEEKVGNKEREK